MVNQFLIQWLYFSILLLLLLLFVIMLHLLCLAYVISRTRSFVCCCLFLFSLQKSVCSYIMSRLIIINIYCSFSSFFVFSFFVFYIFISSCWIFWNRCPIFGKPWEIHCVFCCCCCFVNFVFFISSSVFLRNG